MRRLDLTTIKKEDFTLNECVACLDEYVRDVGVYPDVITITEYQHGVMSSLTLGPWKTWRDIPLEVCRI